MSNRGQILIPTVILIIVVTIIISGVIMFLSEMTRLTLARGHLAKAVELGMKTLYEDGIAKALEGITSVEEVLRVASEE